MAPKYIKMFRGLAWGTWASEQSMDCCLFRKLLFRVWGDRLRQKWERRDREVDSDHPSLTLSVLIRILPETAGLTVTVQIGLCPLSLELCRCSTGFKRANRRDNLSLSHGKVYWLELDSPTLRENKTFSDTKRQGNESGTVSSVAIKHFCHAIDMQNV